MISLPVVLMLYAMPVMPVAHGALYLRVGSQSTFCSAGMRFVLFGNFAASSGCTHGGFTWLMSRLAIQSVSTIPSRPVPLPLRQVGPDLREVLVVVVDVFGVVDADAGRFLEIFQALVRHVAGPVRDFEILAAAATAAGPAAAGAVVVVTAARGEDRGREQHRARGQAGPFEELPAARAPAAMRWFR